MNIGLIGVGRLGLAYALLFEKHGYNVFASSYREDYVQDLKNKKLDSVEPGVDELLETATNIQFTTDNYEVIRNCDVIYVMVATPSTGNGDYDVSAVVNVVNDFVNYPDEVKGKILIVGSTTNPGTCDQLRPIVESRGVRLVYMPTFVAQGTVIKNIENVANIIVGTDDQQVADQCKQIFSSICVNPPTAFVVERKTGEILKLASNCKQTMQISFINMIGQMLLEQGLDNDLIPAGDFLSKAKNNINYKFGFGFGGPCFPRDNRSMVHYANSIGMEYPMGELVDQFNQDHVVWITNYLIEKNTKNLPFYFEYVSYKKGVAQFEESHQLQVCKNLLASGKTVFIEESEFLLSKIQQDLSKEFTNLVKFVTINNINDDVYKISL